MDLQEQGHHLEHVRNKFCTRGDRRDICTDISPVLLSTTPIGGALSIKTRHAFTPERKGIWSWVFNLLLFIRGYIFDKTGRLTEVGVTNNA